MNKKKTIEISTDNPFALSIGDLMAALLLIFILLLCAAILKLEYEKNKYIDKSNVAQKYNQIAQKYKEIQDDLYEDLLKEFRDDLSKWNAVIQRKTLSIRFKEPDVLFELGKWELKNKFKDILSDFFPRYIKILRRSQYINNIEEIRIEGHTSREWITEKNAEKAYFYNMELSQNRTRAVLIYVLNITEENVEKEWTKERITANGLASSKLILFDSGDEDTTSSRRVEFRVRTNAEQQISEMLELDIIKYINK